MFPPSYNSQTGDGDQEQENLNWEWNSPSEDNIVVSFCLDTSLHGMQYLGQPRRHIFERLFWLTAVCAAIGTAGYLIWGMYAEYKEAPIVTIFSPTETPIEQIPFPAVTICNVNNIQKSKFEQAITLAGFARADVMPEDKRNKALAKLLDMYYICDSGNTFTGKFVRDGIAGLIGQEIVQGLFNHTTDDVQKLINPKKTLAESSQPCKEMILYCIWLGKITDCDTLFQEVETDYGYCCTFNMMPTSLLVRPDEREDPVTIAEWEKENLSYDNLLFTEKTKDRKYPFRQQYPGREAGLSVFLDPDLDEYHCTNTDSSGFVLGLNTPLDFPRIKDDGISIPNGSEVLINIRPQITMTDKSVENFSLKNRRCYFGDEFKLPHYTKYTTSNCMDECIANRTKEECDCLRYYMPHNNDGSKKNKFCRPDNYKCVDNVRTKIYQEGLGQACESCLPTCTEIEYQTETTFLTVMDDRVERLFNKSAVDIVLKHVFKHNNNHHPSIVHIYFGVDSTYPRLRTERASYTDLISSAGGILGLCLGFSVLSVLEIIYYLTIRLGCNFYREKTVARTTIVMNFDSGAAAASMKLQMLNAMRGGPGGWPPGTTVNPGILGNANHRLSPRYNTLF